MVHFISYYLLDEVDSCFRYMKTKGIIINKTLHASFIWMKTGQAGNGRPLAIARICTLEF